MVARCAPGAKANFEIPLAVTGEKISLLDCQGGMDHVPDTPLKVEWHVFICRLALRGIPLLFF